MKNKIVFLFLINLLGSTILFAQDSPKSPEIAEWKTYTFGDSNLHLDLPKDPGEPKKDANKNLVVETSVGKIKILIREIDTANLKSYDADFAAANYFDVLQKLGKSGDQKLLFIEPRLIGGLEARLIRTYSKAKVRQIMLVLGHWTEWIIDVESDADDSASLNRIFNSVRYDFFIRSSHKRQTLGKNGLTFAPPPKSEFKLSTVEFNGDPKFQSVEQGFIEYDGGLTVFQEYQLNTGTRFSLDAKAANDFAKLFLESITQDGDRTPVPNPKQAYKIKMGGTDALHSIYEIDMGQAKTDPQIIGDLILFTKNDKLTALFVVTQFKIGESARFSRTLILNSLELKN